MVTLALKRRLSINAILGITISQITDEFIVHGMDTEYDYNYVSAKRKEIIRLINQGYKDIEHRSLKICEVNEKSLKSYVTTKVDKKEQPNFTRMDMKNAYPIDKYLEKFETKKTNNNVNMEQNDGNSLSIHKGKNGKGRTNTMFSRHKKYNEVKLEEFKIIRVIGRGSFGKVCLVEFLPTNEIYAMKSLKKDVLIEQEQIENTLLEKEILQTIDYPFLCGLVFCFQTEERIYFVMPFLSGGELFQHLRKFRTFDEDKVRFYGAQIALALEYLHKKGIIYRDLKPENILMDEFGYLRLADFGMAKKLKEDERAMSFCGTPEYLAPEIITGEGHDKNADWWSFGILLFEMLCGLPPFYTENLDKMYELIKSGPLRFPKKINLSEDAKDVITRLLDRHVKTRLCSHSGIEEIKQHPFFSILDFDEIENKRYPAPFIPQVENKTDVRNFDEEFTSEDVGMSYIGAKNMEVIRQNQDKFKDFSK